MKLSMPILLIRDTVVESHTKVYFNEFVSSALRDNIGMIIFDLGGCGGQKHISAHVA